MDDYCRGLFGPAAGPMKRFYSTLESGVDRWTEKKGKPHWFGKESSPISNGRSVEQYFVLNPEEAARAAQALEEAQKIKQSDPRFSKHIEAVAICFRLQHLAVNEYWAAKRLQNASPKSEADVVRIIEDSRALFRLRLEAADTVEKVMKAPPADKYNLFERVGVPARNVSYGKMASREPLPEYMASISSGMDSAADFLRGKLGPDKAGDWWVKARADEKEPILVKAMQGAETRARGIILQNLIKEPGYEAAGKKIELSELTPGRAIELNKKQYGSLGIRFWNPERSPFKILLQQNDVHSGENAMTMQNCSRARVDTFVRAESTARYRISFWAKCNDTSGSYSYDVFTRSKKSKKNIKISNGTITRQVNEWQNIVTDVETPADCQLLILFIYVRAQKQNTTLILDDIFIAKYPQK
jgi:hypothetical protein